MEEEKKILHETFSVQPLEYFKQELYDTLCWLMCYDSMWRVTFLPVAEQSQKEVTPFF